MTPVAAFVEPVYTDLGVALAVGLLLGLQRERSYALKGRRGMAGARTFPIVALLGALATLVSGTGVPWVTVAGFVGLAALVVAGYLRSSRDAEEIGLTTEVLLLLTYVLGAMAVSGRSVLATVVGAAALVLVSLKSRLHGFAGKLTDEDETAVIKFVAVALLVLPLLPDHGMGPYGAVNPKEIGWVAVLVAGISFVGYVAVKTAGAGRGLLITGLLGGMASTTATTAAFARRSKETPDLSPALAASGLLACSVLYPRILVLVSLVSPAFAGVVWPYLAFLLGATLVVAVSGLVALRRVGRADVPLKNPFELRPAIVFALIYGVVVLGAQATLAWFGAAGLYVTGAIAGTTDLDAIALTAARLLGTGKDPAVLARTVTLAAMANAAVKTGIAFGLGSREYGRRMAVGLLASVVAGGVAFAVL